MTAANLQHPVRRPDPQLFDDLTETMAHPEKLLPPPGDAGAAPGGACRRGVTEGTGRGHTGAVTHDPGDLEPIPGMDPEEPIPDDPGELDHPEELPPAPIEATPDDPGGDPGAEPAVT